MKRGEPVGKKVVNTRYAQGIRKLAKADIEPLIDWLTEYLAATGNRG
ncbi:MAG: hypothetical protein HY897_09410 [Deltaproteobacteria bacterium]|nr:hypothetical protein [Deltaproteobacteria bacterium]